MSGWPPAPIPGTSRWDETLVGGVGRVPASAVGESLQRCGNGWVRSGRHVEIFDGYGALEFIDMEKPG